MVACELSFSHTDGIVDTLIASPATRAEYIGVVGKISKLRTFERKI